MGSLSKHGGWGLCARPFDKLRVTGLSPYMIIYHPIVTFNYLPTPHLSK